MPRQTRADLIEHLRTQMGYIRKSSRDFDGGDVTEAARMAVTLRVLLYNKRDSESLLKQLGVQHQLAFLDTASIPASHGPGSLVHEFSSGLGMILIDDEGAHYGAPLGVRAVAGIHGPQPFKTWWNRRVLKDMPGSQFTRRELVLFLAHKEGGAHVGPELSVPFAALTRMNSLGWGWRRTAEGTALTVPAGPDDEPLGSPIPVNVRQIAYEVEETITGQLAALLSPTLVD